MKTTTKETPKYTKEFLKEKLSTNAQWAIRGMLAIYKYQTEQEQASEQTVEDNGVGFSGCDANILSSFAKQYKQWQRLSDKQMALVHKKMPRYAGQLLKIIEQKQP